MADLQRHDIQWNVLRRGDFADLCQITKPARYRGSFAVLRRGDDAMLESFSATEGDKARRRFSLEEQTLFECAYLGGYGVSLEPTARYDICFGGELGIKIRRAGSSKTAAQLPFGEVEHIELGGPGAITTTSGGGFIGGGFGLQGAAEGMAVASVLNALTTKSKTTVNSVLEIVGETSQMFFLNQELTPDQLKIWLSGPLGKVKAARRAEPSAATVASAVAAPSRGPNVQDLVALADLHTRGLLTEEEFALAKKRLLEDR